MTHHLRQITFYSNETRGGSPIRGRALCWALRLHLGDSREGPAAGQATPDEADVVVKVSGVLRTGRSTTRPVRTSRSTRSPLAEALPRARDLLWVGRDRA